MLVTCRNAELVSLVVVQVTGDSWDSRPQLKLRLLKLMVCLGR
jgi:hypothetical protein